MGGHKKAYLGGRGRLLLELMRGNAPPPPAGPVCALAPQYVAGNSKFTPLSSYSLQDFPNYKYRPRRKKRDGQKGQGGQSNTNNNSSSINNNRSNGGSPASLIEKSELLEEKLEKVNFLRIFYI